MQQWWLTFADPRKPEGERFLGVVIVNADSFGDAIDEAWRQQVNPGGELEGIALPLGTYPDRYTNRLLSREDVAAMENDVEASEDAPW